MSQSNRTPFDNDLLHDPQAPRDTQPLSPLAANTPPTPNAQVPVAQAPSVVQAPSVAQAPPVVFPTSARPLPPQVMSGNLAPDDDDAAMANPARNTGRLPTPTIIGLAMAGGALGVILLSGLIYRAIPRANVKGLAPTQTTVIETTRPASPRVTKMPAAVTTEDGTTEDTSSATDSRAPSSTSATSRNTTRRNTPDEGAASSASDSTRDATDGTTSIEADSSSDDTIQSGTRVARSNGSRSNGSRSSDSTESVSRDRSSRSATGSDTNATRASNGNASVGTASGSSSTSRRVGYSIKPPPGFRLVQEGRRTIWRGPDGAQILVETAAVGQSSPRRDWERLDAALAKKYGARYRSRGISDTRIAGRDAAAWEFELDGKNGTTRKIDVAVHHQGRGYAILGSAPAGKFDAIRPQLEAAIDSFQLREEGDAPSSSRRNTRRRDVFPPSTSDNAPVRSESGDEHYSPDADSSSAEGY